MRGDSRLVNKYRFFLYPKEKGRRGDPKPGMFERLRHWEHSRHSLQNRRQALERKLATLMAIVIT